MGGVVGTVVRGVGAEGQRLELIAEAVAVEVIAGGIVAAVGVVEGVDVLGDVAAVGGRAGEGACAISFKLASIRSTPLGTV